MKLGIQTSISILSATATLNFPLTAAGIGSDLTINVPGASDGDIVTIGCTNATISANAAVFAWVSSANTVTVRYINYSIAGIDPASGIFKIKVIKN